MHGLLLELSKITRRDVYSNTESVNGHEVDECMQLCI